MNSNQQETQNGPAYTVVYGKFYTIKKLIENKNILVERRVLVEVLSVIDHSTDFNVGRY